MYLWTAVLVLLCAWLTAASALAQEEANGPLPPCPETPSCATDARVYPHEPEHLFDFVRRAIHRMSPVDLDIDEESMRLTAAFRVFFFLDDLTVVLERMDVGTELHIRSESRSAFWDAGTNRRRINGFFDRLERLISDAPVDSVGNG